VNYVYGHSLAYTVIMFSEVEHESNFAKVRIDYIHGQLQGVQLKSGLSTKP